MEVWPAGAPVLWRSVHEDAVATVVPMRVVSDDGGTRALYLSPGTNTKRRTGTRGGPSGRMLVRWDGGYQDRPWSGNHVLMLNNEGDPFSIWLLWNEKWELQCWYINLEDPWRRTPLGYDSRDRILDIVVSPDLTEWEWKDEDEFKFRLEEAKASQSADEAVRNDGMRALQRLRDQRENFERWRSWKPDPSWPVPPVVDGWDRLIAKHA